MNADGSAPMNLTNDAADPAWSPDGKRIAFGSGRSGSAHLHVMDADGKNAGQFSEFDNPRGYVYPAWSPEGKTIAYTDASKDDLEIFALDLASRKRMQLTKLGGLNTQVCWSPTGKHMAFLHSRLDASSSLYVMSSDGNNCKELLKDEVPLEGGRPAWRPMKPVHR